MAEASVSTLDRRGGRPPNRLTSLVGRRAELAMVGSVLATARAVCLTGPGGCGKTRLAIEVAETAAHGPDSVCWVDLASLTEARSIPRALANAVGARESAGRPLLDSVFAHLGNSTRLIVLDNCEHLLPECARIAQRLLVECPGVRLLTTSRQVLGIDGEVVWPVPPLSMPTDAGRDAAALRSYESVQLFCQRAEVVRPGFMLDDKNAASVARICRDLDGLPLAIELAAARVRVLSVEEIADALENLLTVLTGVDRGTDRHRSMRAALDWSYRLLTEPERRLLAEMSAFTAGCTLDALQAVHEPHEDEPPVLDLVAHLVDRSLVNAVADGGRTRYSLLETVRVYAAEHLGDAAAVQARRTQWYVTFAESVEPKLSGPDQAHWLDRVEAERGNISGVLRWSLREHGCPREGLRIIAALWRFCYLRGYYSEGRSWLSATLAATPDAPLSLRARALVGSGILAHMQCEYDEATERLEDALAAYRQMSDDRGVAAVLHSLGSVARERGRYDAARALHTESRTLWQRLKDGEGTARSANYLSLLAWLQHDLPTAVELAEEALEGYRVVGDAEGVAWSLINLAASALYETHRNQAAELLRESLSSSRAVGYREGVAWSLNLLGVLHLEQADHSRAYGLLQESLREHWSLGDRWRAASVLETVAAVDALTGRHERAARVIGAASALRSAIGAPIPPVERDLMHRATSTLDAALGAEAWHGIERLGRLADIDTVVGEVLASAAPQSVEPIDAEAPRVTQRHAQLGVTTLGSCRVHLDDVPVASAEFGYAKPRELLCFLLDRRDATKDQIGAALWPWASPSGLRSSFHTCLHHVRSALGADRVVFSDGRYGINRALPYDYDVESFEMLLGRARTGTDAEEELQRAIALYHGDYLADLPGETWIDERRRQLRRAFERALSDLGRLHARAGRNAEAIDVLHRAVEHDPLMEAAHRELMRCYAASGERGAALRQYRTLTALLREELGAEPTPETAALNAQIRRGDPL